MTILLVVCVAALTAVGAWVIWEEARTPDTAARRRLLTERIEQIRLAELEAMWRTPAHTNRRR